MDQLCTWLKASKFTVVFTGAGMSTESGLPDFRSAQAGLWRSKDPARLASTHALQHNREEFLDFYRMRIEALLSCKPHAGHVLLAEWERRGLIQGIITQNVDGYHQQAGSQHIAELHGSLTTLSCLVCEKTYTAARYQEENGWVCPCGGFLRPDVVLFGEALPASAFEQALNWTEQADLFLVLGSSLSVSPANWFPQQAKERGARLVIVNREPTILDDLADAVIHERSIGEVLKEMDLAMKK
ncbi:NAD-dependent deacylase [Brevibacillus ruminantium]|uniref:protein acetyllysine N-acetyltransferase n=1 Tax=Brevibacillus ruminantium TaxID=2950604 RepID=A0ABY4WCQ1_9BACL|nr:NAD-dependent deacylase [Brevibacillus ruminantium]USG63938.1 NAD-dependent deacylase [Brevibacillus ruminantium]